MADPSGEIPVDKDFCERMVAAREKRGLTQKQLASRIGTSQNTISSVESGKSSKFLLAICKTLKIPGPLIGFNEQQRKWALLGHALEERSGGTFSLALERMEALLKELPEPGAAVPAQKVADTKPVEKKPLRPLASPKLGGHDREQPRRLRAADELSIETKSKR